MSEVWTQAGSYDVDDSDESPAEPPRKTLAPFPPRLEIHQEVRGKSDFPVGDETSNAEQVWGWRIPRTCKGAST